MKNLMTPFRFNLLIILALITAALLWANSGVTKDLARLERILDVLESSPDFLWHQRPNLSTEFEGASAYTDSDGFRLARIAAIDNPPPATDRKPFIIVTLGASPTFGYGVKAEEAYPALVGEMLRRERPEIRVINAGEIGFSSWQGLKLAAKYLDQWRPDLITVSYVVNDIDRLRFFYSNGKTDYQTDLPSAASSAISNFVAQTWPLSFFSKQQRRLLVKLFSNMSQRKSYEMTQVRSLPAEYEKNLREFARIAAERGVPLLFIKMPFRLPEEIPPASAELVQTLERIAKLIDSGEYDQARSAADELYAGEKHASRLYYLRGRLAENAGDSDGAKEEYRQAMRHVIYDCARDARYYNTIMEKTARALNIPLVDPAARLGGVSADMEYFVPGDYIHPNAAGHKIIADCVAAALHRMLDGESGFFLQECK
mgnify:CR=1 FL=1